MLKKDPIFWGATGIFIAALVLAALTQNDQWLFLMVASYLLRPTLASLGLTKGRIDERQMSIQYRSGNIAFTVMLVASIVLAITQRMKGDHSWELFNIVIILGLVSKALFNVLLVKNYPEAGARIIMTAGLLVVLFVAAENGPTLGGLIESAPWLAIVAVGWIARKYPKPVGALIFAVTAALLFFMLGKELTVDRLALALALCVPLGLAGACLFAPNRSDAAPTKDAKE